MIDYTLPLYRLPNPLPIEPLARPFDVTITPPGSKSITCRAYVLAALSKGESRIIRPLRADDTEKLLTALCALGVEARWECDDVLITGVDGRFPRGGEVNLGDGGAPTRFMIACACLAAEPVIVDGSARMRERPIAEGVNMLRQIGAEIAYVEAEGRLPVRVIPSVDFAGGEVKIGRTFSSQPVSALLLIGRTLRNGITIRFGDGFTSESYVELTWSLLREWGAVSDADRGASKQRTGGGASGTDDRRFLKVDPGPLRAKQIHIEPDASSGLYWLLAAAVVSGGQIHIPAMRKDSEQPDAALVEMLEESGCRVRESLDGSGEYSLTAAWGTRWRGLTFDGRGAPDGVVGVGALLGLADGSSSITGLHTLRHKESDRIAALARELRKIGCRVETTDDSITIDPSSRHGKPATIETYNDHRMAMAFAVLGLARDGISIKDPHVVSKSYPTFWKDFAKLYQ